MKSANSGCSGRSAPLYQKERGIDATYLQLLLMIIFINLQSGTLPFLEGPSSAFTSIIGSTRSLMSNHKLFPRVDWEKVDAGQYAVVDPVNPGQILYLSEQDYVVMIRVALTTNKTLKVLAAPGESPDQSASPSQNSPLSNHPFIEGLTFGGKGSAFAARAKGRVRYLFHSTFGHLRPKRTGSDVDTSSMIKLTVGNIRDWFCQWHDLVSWWTRGYQVSTVVTAERSSFSSYLLNILKNNGVNFLITYLKGSLFIITAFLGGRRMTTKEVSDLMGRRMRMRHGLPASLPCYVRNGIRSGSIHYIHIWTTMMNSYKGIEGKYGAVHNALATIYLTPHPDFRGDVWFRLFRVFAEKLWLSLQRKGLQVLDLKVKNLFFTSKAGPNHTNAVLGSALDASLWFKLHGKDNLIMQWINLLDDIELSRLFRRQAKAYDLNTHLISSIAAVGKTTFPSLFGVDRSLNNSNRGVLARLCALFEPAGKIRIVAIVDYWTQVVLKPLHDWMFSCLRLFPQDATFDQEGALRRFSRRGYYDVWSFDLSAATDTIPLLLYRAVFCWIIPERFLQLWIELLVDRDYLKPSEAIKELTKQTGVCLVGEDDRVRYSCGQPMGALSSWASMALVHHALVLFAFYLVECERDSRLADRDYLVRSRWNPLDFLHYLVLGDDLVIADKRVAEEYLALTKRFGIKVGMAKSHISEIGLFNFANQTYKGDLNISPLSFREEVAVNSLAARSEFAMRAVRRGWTDMTKQGWVAPLIKLFVSPKVWTVIQQDLRKGLTHPIVNWILSVLLVPGSARFAETILPRASIKCYLATLLRKAVIWSKPLGNLDTLINEWRSWPLIHSIVYKYALQIDKEFLNQRKRLGAFGDWLESTMSAELDFLLKRIFLEQKTEAIKRWDLRFRRPVKEVKVLFSLSSLQPHMVPMGVERDLEQCVELLTHAEAELPRVPDFLSMDLSALTEVLSTRDPTELELQRFFRLTSLIGCQEHLGNLTTPGLVVPSHLDVPGTKKREDDSTPHG